MKDYQVTIDLAKKHLNMEEVDPDVWAADVAKLIRIIESIPAETLVRRGRSLPDVACGNCKRIEFWYMKIKIQDEWMDGVSGEYNFVKQYCDAITDHDWKIIKVTQYRGDKEEEIESKPSA
jgi:hypothetical protein